MAGEPKFSKAVLDTSYRTTPGRMQAPRIREVAERFVANLDRVVGLLKTPVVMHVLLDHVTLATLHGAPEWPKIPDTREEMEQMRELRGLFGEQFAGTFVSSVGNLKADAACETPEEWRDEAAAVDDHIRLLNSVQVSHAFDAILSASIIGAWTAFEALAGDLWEACLNGRPRLGFVALDVEPAEEDDDETRERKRRVRYNMPMRLLKKWDYNLKDRMGTLLRGKWDFTRRDQATDAYLKVFGRREKDAKPLRDIFQDNCLKHLAATRNAIIHKAGVADAEFFKLTRDHPILSAVKEDEVIPVDGALVGDLIPPAISRGVELLECVDKWLSENKE